MPRFWKIASTLFFLLAAKTGVAAASVSVLFVGNSLIQANDLPTVFKQFAAQSALHVDVDVNSITPGGAFLYDHWTSGVALGRLRELQPNFLILQGQSIEPLLAPLKFNYYASLFKTDADAQGQILFLPTARQFVNPAPFNVLSNMISLLLFAPCSFLAQETSFDYSHSTSGKPPGPVFWICWSVFVILMVAAMWKVFTKAGRPGWAALIPIVNVYFLCKVAGRPGWWLILMLIPLVNFIILIILDIDVAKNFGKGVGFGIGLLLLPVIFFPILGFGSAQYQGASPPPPV